MKHFTSTAHFYEAEGQEVNFHCCLSMLIVPSLHNYSPIFASFSYDIHICFLQNFSCKGKQSYADCVSISIYPIMSDT